MSRRFTRILMYLLALTTLAGVGGLLWHLREQRVPYYTDADSIRRPVAGTATRDVLWTPPVAVDGAVNSPRGEYGPRVTHDGLLMYLVRGEAGSNADIFVATRTPDGWSEPVPFAPVQTLADELDPEPTRDGRSVFFASNRAGGAGGYDVWVVHRDDDAESGWGEPVNLGPGVNTAYHEYSLTVTADADEIWFASNRPGEGEIAMPGADESVIVREDLYRGDFDLYRAPLTAGAADAAPAQPVHALNSPDQEGAPALSPTGDFLYFSSNRRGGHGGFDIYRARLVPQIGAPMCLAAPVNSEADELDPGISVAGFGLHFSSDRVIPDPDAASGDQPGADDGAPATDVADAAAVPAAEPDHDLYFASSREVYTATDVFRATIDWLALLPYILWIVIALLLLLLLWSFSRVLASERYRTLGLLAKCLIASMFIHALLLFGFAFWGVGNSVSEWIVQRGTRVAIVSPSVGSDLAAQVRGTVTDVAMDAQVVSVEQLDETVAPPEAERSPTELTVAQTTIDAHEPAPATDASDAPAATPTMPDRTEPAEVEPVSGMALDLEIEAAPAPTASAETAVEIPAQMPADVPAPDRHALDSAPSEVRPVLSTPAPSPAAQVAGAQTIVETDGARDAQPAPAHTTVQASVAQRAVTVTTALPSVPEAAVQRTGETESTVTSVAVDAPRARQPVQGPATSSQTARVDVSPVEAAATPQETSLAAVGASARTPGAPDLPAPQAMEPLPEAASALALDLPAMSTEGAASAQEESVVSVTSADVAAPATVRATASVAPVGATAEIVLTEPAAGSFEPAVATGIVAAASATTVRDAMPSVSAPAPRSTLAAQTPALLPDLPPVPEASAEFAGETERSVLPFGGAAARARSTVQGPETKAQGARVDVRPVEASGPRADTSLVALAAAERIPGAPALATPSPSRPAAGPSATLAFDLPAPSADIAPPAVEPVVLVDARDMTTPAARQRLKLGAEMAASTAAVHTAPDEAAMDPAADARLASAAPALLAVDAPPPIDLPPLEVQRLAVAPRRELELEVPFEEMVAPSPQRQRAPESRMKIVKEMGGNEETERAVEMSLDWLARHQSRDGRWDSDGYDDQCNSCSGSTRVDVDIALTGLSMLCFLATDHTHMKEGPYQETMTRALEWLLRQQGPDGDLLGDESMYSHGIASIAIAEAYGMTGDPELKEPVQNAIDFIVAARNRRGGGWRYAPGQAGDTSVLGWQMMAMKSAASAGIEVDPAGFASVERWLESIRRLAPPGLYVYQPGRPHSPAMTAEGTFVHQLLGSDPDRVDMDASVEFLLAHPPRWDEEANTYYWYYATLALFQYQGDAWRRWNEQVRDELVEHQVKSGGAAGSWAPNDQWSRTGGRIYQTAICTLTLEVYYRYLPRFVKTANR